MTLAQIIGSNIKRQRMKLRLTQQMLANRFGWQDRSSVASIECGYSVPDLTTLYALAHVLKCDLFDLVPRQWTTQKAGDK